MAIDKPITVRSANGPDSAVIVGASVPGGGNGDGAIRCAYVGTNAVLSGFTLTNGHTRTVYGENYGGGVWCEDSGVVTNCVLTSNSASAYGGGARGGTLYRCTLAANSATGGGGAYSNTLRNCILIGNSAGHGNGGLWTNVPGQTEVRGSGGMVALRDTNALPRRFYRVEVRAPAAQ